jgi:hypothetical protein
VDLIIVAASIYAAVLLVRSGLITQIISRGSNYLILESFVAGLFFTSVFTTAPAIAALAQISRAAPSITPVVIFGALGAVCGDLIIFSFMKDRIYQDVMYVLGERKGIKSLFRAKLFRWLSFLIGGLIISSPLPDELGIAMMGLSKVGIAAFIPVSVIFNALGVLLISLGGKFI